MSTTYVRKQELVEVEVITPDLFDQLKASDPDFMKSASVGDYLVRSTEDVRILSPEKLARLYEAPRRALDGEQLDAVGKALEGCVAGVIKAGVRHDELDLQVQALLKASAEQAADFAGRLAKLEARAAELSGNANRDYNQGGDQQATQLGLGKAKAGGK
jgi:hypothetical protein